MMRRETFLIISQLCDHPLHHCTAPLIGDFHGGDFGEQSQAYRSRIPIRVTSNFKKPYYQLSVRRGHLFVTPTRFLNTPSCLSSSIPCPWTS